MSQFLPWFARRCDDSNTPQFDRRPVGALSVLRGGSLLSSPLRASAQDSHRLPCRQNLAHPVTGRDVRLSAVTSSGGITWPAQGRRSSQRLAPRRAQRLRQVLPLRGCCRALLLQYRDTALELSTALRQSCRFGEGRSFAGPLRSYSTVKPTCRLTAWYANPDRSRKDAR